MDAARSASTSVARVIGLDELHRQSNFAGKSDPGQA